MGFYKPEQGDRVRVVLEGEAHSVGVSRRKGSFGVGANYINPENEHVMSVEKVEPPVVTFKPGDTVRFKNHGGDGPRYTVGRGGYLYHGDGSWIDSETDFTSDRYELVELK